MQHDMMRPSGQPTGSDNVGDVLASIRRLIAQDEGAKQLPGRPMGENPFAQQNVSAISSAISEPPFVLAHDDLIPPPATEQPRQDAPRLQLASISMAAVQAGPALAAPAGWQPSLIADWPHAKVTQTAMTLSEPLQMRVATVQPGIEAAVEPSLSPEEEAEFAEAEAALAKMVHVSRALSSPEPDVLADALSPDGDAEGFAEDITEADSALESDFGVVDAPVHNLFVDPSADQDAALREMIRNAIREELQGETGNLLSRNMRQMIRHEVEAVIRDLCAET